jgi:hypothetical protein
MYNVTKYKLLKNAPNFRRHGQFVCLFDKKFTV